jgi:DNA-binding HxlR family transcriptional regulator
MYKRKITEDLDCGITISMRVFCNKWKPCIIDAISRGYGRPSEMHRQIPEAKPRVLDIQLSELLKLGIVSKQSSSGFPLHSIYTLTQLGQSIIPIVHQLDHWGSTHQHQLKELLLESA